MGITAPGPTAATPAPARPPGLARVLLAGSVLALALRPLASTLLLGNFGDDVGGIGDASDLQARIALINVISGLLSLVAAGLAVAVIVLGARSLTGRTAGAGRWHETTGLSCVAAAGLVVCLPVHLLPLEAEGLMTLYTVVSGVAAVAALMGLVFVGLALRAAGRSPGDPVPTRGPLAAVLAAGTVLVLSLGSTGMFVALAGPSGAWLQPLVMAVSILLALASLVLAVLSRRVGPSAPAVGSPDEAPGAALNPYAQGAGAAGGASGGAGEDEHRGLLALRLLGTPAALSTVLLSVVFGDFVMGLLLLGGVLALAAVIGAVVESRRRTDRRRWLDAVGEVLVPLALLVTPLAMLITGITSDSDWAVLGALIWGGLLTVLVGLLGLIFTVVSAVGGRHSSTAGAVSAVATAATFIPVALFVPMLSANAGAVMAVLAGLCLLVGLVAGGIAVARRQRSPASPGRQAPLDWKA